jgi:hypothetical protein
MSSKKSIISRARRLTFSYKDTSIKLISQQQLEKILPPSDNFTKNNKSGFWYEVADGRKKVLYQKAISNPIETDIELFSNESKESIMRQKTSKIEGTFSILVPDLPNAKTFSLHGNPIERNQTLVQKPSIKLFEMNLGAI